MDFFHRYKDLFNVTEDRLRAHNRLTVDNQIFVEKPFVNTYAHTISLNSKLKDLHREYDAFEAEVSHLTELQTKRVPSRKGRDSQNKTSMLSEPPSPQMKLEIKPLKFHAEQPGVLRRSELTHVFEDQLPNSKLHPNQVSDRLIKRQMPQQLIQTAHQIHNQQLVEYRPRAPFATDQAKKPSRQQSRQRRQQAKGRLQVRRGQLKRILEDQY